MENFNDSVDPKEKSENNPSEAITNPEEVQESNDENIDKDFPGYPHHPANEDLLNDENNEGRVDVDIEDLSAGGKNAKAAIDAAATQPDEDLVNAPVGEGSDDDEDDDIEMVPGTDADVTAEDLILLGSKDQDMDMGEDEDYVSVSSLLDKADYELDTPGAELDDANEAIGEEDEENNYYSLGGERHEDLEERKD